MARVKGAMMTRKRRNKTLKLAKSYYSRFMNGLKKSGIEMNRKALSELAITDAEAFKVLVETAKKAI